MKQLTQKSAVLAFWATTTLSIIGMAFQVLLMKDVDLNYFNYAETSDMLIAAGIAITAFFDLPTDGKILASTVFIIYCAGLLFLLPHESIFQQKKINALLDKKRLIQEYSPEDSKAFQQIKDIESEIEKRQKNQNFSRKYHFLMKLVLWLMLIGVSLSVLSSTANKFSLKVAQGKVRPIELIPISSRTTVPQLASGNKFYLLASTSQFYFVYERNDPRGNKAESITSITHVIPRNAVTLSMTGVS